MRHLLTSILRHWGILSFCMMIAAGCAKVMPLTGGDQDTAPPSFRSSLPDTFALNFTGKEITLRFDEYIVLKDPTREIFVSPTQENPPEVTAVGKNIKIKFKDSLRKDFTYIIQFGKSISDLNEGNVNTGFRFVFSTGSVLDTGIIKGRITDAYRQKPSEGFKVMLYDKTVNDSFPYREKPLYVTFSDGSGQFEFRNIREDGYKIFALKEENNNYLYDRAGEEIAFLNRTVRTGESDPLEMLSFKEEVENPSLLKVRSVNAFKTEFSFYGLAAGLQIKALNLPESDGFPVREWSASQDTLFLWHKSPETDSLTFWITLNGKTDTVSIKVNRAGANLSAGGGGKKGPGPAKPEQAVSFSVAGNLSYPRYTPPYLLFQEPPVGLSPDKLTLTADSVPVEVSLTVDSLNPRKWYVNFPLKGTPKLILQADSGAVSLLSGKSLPKFSFSFSPRPERDFGNIILKLTDSVPPAPKIWRLESNGKLIQQKITDAQSDKITFEKLEPSTYQLIVIIDEDQNGRWTSGNYLLGKLPEKIFVLSEPINLKKGWDSELDWKINPSKRGKAK